MSRVKNNIDKPNSLVIIRDMGKPTEEERKKYASYLGSIKSKRKAESSKRNGKLGGRPKKKKEGMG